MGLVRGDALLAAGAARAGRLPARGMLVLPQPVRAARGRRGPALGTGGRGRRVRLRLAAPALDAPHRPRPLAGGAQVRRPLAPGPPLGAAHAGARLGDAGLPVALPHGPGAARRARRRARAGRGAGPQGAVQLQAGPDDSALPEPGGPRLRRGHRRHARHRDRKPAGAVRQARGVEGQDAHRDRAVRGAAGAGRLHAEARHQPRGVARRVRAPGDLGQRDDAAQYRAAGGRAARPSTSVAASAATAPRATATAPRRRSSIPGRATSRSARSSSARRRRARCPPTATSIARSPAACAGPRCPRGTSCPRRTGSR